MPVRKKILFATAALMMSFPVVSNADELTDSLKWIIEGQNEQCSDESKQKVAESVRGQIESAMARAMAAIKPPAAIGDLSCLNDLMNAPLDMFSNLGGIMGTLQTGLQGKISSSIGGGGDISRRVCDFAAVKWKDIAGPITASVGDLQGGASNIWDNFDLKGNGSAPTNSASGSSTPTFGDFGDVSGTGNDNSPVENIPYVCTEAAIAADLCDQNQLGHTVLNGEIVTVSVNDEGTGINNGGTTVVTPGAGGTSPAFNTIIGGGNND